MFKNRLVLLSFLIHGVVAAIALRAASEKEHHKKTSVAVVGAEKKRKAEEKPKPPPPRTPPRPKVASTRPEAARPVEAPPKSTAPETAPVRDSDVKMSNDDGPGIPLDGGPGSEKAKGDQPKAEKPQKTAPKKSEKAKALADNPEDDPCSEAPSKPSPVQKPNEIEYTQEARANGVEGRLVLRISVAADGSVDKVEVVSSVDAALDAAAIAAVKSWTFKPSMRCGKAMAGGVFTLARKFELGD